MSGELDQRLKVSTLLAEDRNHVPRTPVKWLTAPCSSSSWVDKPEHYDSSRLPGSEEQPVLGEEGVTGPGASLRESPYCLHRSTGPRTTPEVLREVGLAKPLPCLRHVAR